MSTQPTIRRIVTDVRRYERPVEPGEFDIVTKPRKTAATATSVNVVQTIENGKSRMSVRVILDRRRKDGERAYNAQTVVSIPVVVGDFMADYYFVAEFDEGTQRRAIDFAQKVIAEHQAVEWDRV